MSKEHLFKSVSDPHPQLIESPNCKKIYKFGFTYMYGEELGTQTGMGSMLQRQLMFL